VPKEQQQADANEQVVKNAELVVKEEKPDRVAFSVKYDLSGDGARPVEESFVVTKEGVEATSSVAGDKPAATRVLLPAFVNTGEKDVEATVAGNKLTTRRGNAEMTWTITEPASVNLEMIGPQVAIPNGYIRAVVGELPSAAPQVKWKVTLQSPR
jgi:hypothetical protein